ncbi:hypothetical protein ACFQX6_46600 [Streptosporangium lutulentum]
MVSVCDEPVIGSLGSGVVRWSREQTAALVAAEPALAKELAERGGTCRCCACRSPPVRSRSPGLHHARTAAAA